MLTLYMTSSTVSTQTCSLWGNNTAFEHLCLCLCVCVHVDIQYICVCSSIHTRWQRWFPGSGAPGRPPWSPDVSARWRSAPTSRVRQKEKGEPQGSGIQSGKMGDHRLLLILLILLKHVLQKRFVIGRDGSPLSIPWTGYIWWRSAGSSESTFLERSKIKKLAFFPFSLSSNAYISGRVQLAPMLGWWLTEHTEGDEEYGVSSVQGIGRDHHCYGDKERHFG